MANSRIGVTIILGLLGFTSFGQGSPLIYGGADYFRNTSYVANSYININLGSQLLRWKFIAPEIGYDFHFGIVRDNNLLNPKEPNARAPSKVRTRFATHSFSIAPKIIIGNEEAAFVFIPQYNTGKINARGDLLTGTGRDYTLAEQQRISDSVSFWSFASGVEGQFFDSDILHFSLLLKYHLLNTENAFNQIDLKNTDLKIPGGSADGIGFSFRVYFDFLQLFKNK